MRKYTYLLLFLLCLTGCTRYSPGDKVVFVNGGSVNDTYTIVESRFEDVIGLTYILIDKNGNITSAHKTKIAKLPNLIQ